jgi:predicted transposase/invertase (TIGR01784 family)
MDTVFFSYEDDIINPCWDNVFKAIFTRDTPESRGALRELLTAIIGRKLTVLTITANEPPVDGMGERQIRYDINCKAADGEPYNIEMTLNPYKYEPLRLEYYSCKLFTSQDIRGSGKSYSDLKHSYQISLLVNDPIYEDGEFVHHFKYYDDVNGMSLNGRSHIITIELSKLEEISRKPVLEMTALERWSVFFRYTPDKGKRGIINEIIRSEEGIAMGAQVLLSFSKDEIERARLLSEYKFAVDLQSKMVNSRRAGVKEGIEKGIVIGREEGREESREEEILIIVAKLLKRGMSEAEISELLDMSISRVMELKEKQSE